MLIIITMMITRGGRMQSRATMMIITITMMITRRDKVQSRVTKIIITIIMMITRRGRMQSKVTMMIIISDDHQKRQDAVKGGHDCDGGAKVP